MGGKSNLRLKCRHLQISRLWMHPGGRVHLPSCYGMPPPHSHLFSLVDTQIATL